MIRDPFERLEERTSALMFAEVPDSNDTSRWN